jgi:tetratricopeptide (TPR) repeat protein
VISYYGLCLALHRGKHREGLELCQAAIDAEPMKAEYYANLAEVCAEGRQRRKAVSALQRGLAIDSGNARLLELQMRLGARRSPVIASLGRSHPVNVTLGRIRHVLAGPPKAARRSGNTKSG